MSNCCFPNTPLTFEAFISFALKTLPTKLAAKLFLEQLCLQMSISSEAVQVSFVVSDGCGVLSMIACEYKRADETLNVSSSSRLL